MCRPKDSFIQFKNFKSASSSALLLRGAPDSTMVKTKFFKTIIECVGKRPIDRWTDDVLD